jgi:transposase-like protein
MGTCLRHRDISNLCRLSLDASTLLVAIGVNESGYREILGICEGAKEDKSGWSGFLKHLKERGLKGVRLIFPASHGRPLQKPTTHESQKK